VAGNDYLRRRSSDFGIVVPDQYIVQALVGAPTETVGAPGQHLRRLLELFPSICYYPRFDLFRAGQERQSAGTAPVYDAVHRPGHSGLAAAFSDDGEIHVAGGMRALWVAGLLSA